MSLNREGAIAREGQGAVVQVDAAFDALSNKGIFALQLDGERIVGIDAGIAGGIACSVNGDAIERQHARFRVIGDARGKGGAWVKDVDPVHPELGERQPFIGNQLAVFHRDEQIQVVRGVIFRFADGDGGAVRSSKCPRGSRDGQLRDGVLHRDAGIGGNADLFSRNLKGAASREGQGAAIQEDAAFDALSRNGVLALQHDGERIVGIDAGIAGGIACSVNGDAVERQHAHCSVIGDALGGIPRICKDVDPVHPELGGQGHIGNERALFHRDKLIQVVRGVIFFSADGDGGAVSRKCPGGSRDGQLRDGVLHRDAVIGVNADLFSRNREGAIVRKGQGAFVQVDAAFDALSNNGVLALQHDGERIVGIDAGIAGGIACSVNGDAVERQHAHCSVIGDALGGIPRICKDVDPVHPELSGQGHIGIQLAVFHRDELIQVVRGVIIFSADGDGGAVKSSKCPIVSRDGQVRDGVLHRDAGTGGNAVKASRNLKGAVTREGQGAEVQVDAAFEVLSRNEVLALQHNGEGTIGIDAERWGGVRNRVNGDVFQRQHTVFIGDALGSIPGICEDVDPVHPELSGQGHIGNERALFHRDKLIQVVIGVIIFSADGDGGAVKSRKCPIGSRDGQLRDGVLHRDAGIGGNADLFSRNLKGAASREGQGAAIQEDAAFDALSRNGVLALQHDGEGAIGIDADATSRGGASCLGDLSVLQRQHTVFIRDTLGKSSVRSEDVDSVHPELGGGVRQCRKR